MTDTLDPVVADAFVARCTVCGSGLLLDPDQRHARLWHYGDGSHSVVLDPADPPATTPTRTQARVAMLAVLVRLEDVATDLRTILAALEADP